MDSEEQQSITDLQEIENYGIRPFHLDRFRSGKPCRTRNGRVAKYLGLCVDPQCADWFRLVVYVKGCASPIFLKPNGLHQQSSETYLHPDDLFMTPPVMNVWFNIMSPAYNTPKCNHHFSSRAAADNNANGYRVACVGPICVCEGDGIL